MYPSTLFDRFERAQLPLLYVERAPEFYLSIIYILTEYWRYEIKKKGVWSVTIWSTVKRRYVFLGEFKRKSCNNASITQAYNMYELGLK